MNNDTNTNNANENIAADAAKAFDEMTDEQALDLFIEGIMEEKGVTLEGLARVDMANELKARLLKEIDRSLIAELPEEKMDELLKEVEKRGKIRPELVANAVTEAKLDTSEIALGTMAKFREVYLGENADGAASPADANEEAQNENATGAVNAETDVTEKEEA